MDLCVLKNKLKLYQGLHMGSWCRLGATKPVASGLILYPPGSLAAGASGSRGKPVVSGFKLPHEEP